MNLAEVGEHGGREHRERERPKRWELHDSESSTDPPDLCKGISTDPRVGLATEIRDYLTVHHDRFGLSAVVMALAVLAIRRPAVGASFAVGPAVGQSRQAAGRANHRRCSKSADTWPDGPARHSVGAVASRSFASSR